VYGSRPVLYLPARVPPPGTTSHFFSCRQVGRCTRCLNLSPPPRLPIRINPSNPRFFELLSSLITFLFLRPFPFPCDFHRCRRIQTFPIHAALVSRLPKAPQLTSSSSRPSSAFLLPLSRFHLNSFRQVRKPFEVKLLLFRPIVIFDVWLCQTNSLLFEPFYLLFHRPGREDRLSSSSQTPAPN